MFFRRKVQNSREKNRYRGKKPGFSSVAAAPIETKGIRDDTQRTRRHRQRAEDRRQAPMEERMEDSGGFQIVLRRQSIFVRADGKILSLVFRTGIAAMPGDGKQHDVVTLFGTFLLVGIAGPVHEFGSGQHLEIGFVRPAVPGNIGE